jgi:hypothetical protein
MKRKVVIDTGKFKAEIVCSKVANGFMKKAVLF